MKPTTPTEAIILAMNDLAADLERAIDRFAVTMKVGIDMPASPNEHVEIDAATLGPLFAALTNLSRHGAVADGVVQDLVRQFKGVRAAMGIHPACPCGGCVDKAAADAAKKATDDVASMPAVLAPRPTHGPGGQPLN